MRIANVDNRLVLVGPRNPAARAGVDAGSAGVADVAKSSGGLFDPEVEAVYERWDEFRAWVADAHDLEFEAYDEELLGAPSPSPRQVFAIGLNYSAHAVESGFAVPKGTPPVFTKFPTCITGPRGDIQLPPGGHTDWEIELVVVIGHRAEHVSRGEAWSHVAGLTVGQDLSERIVQMSGPSPQFSLGKSYPRFGPLGPVLVSPDEFAAPDDLRLVSIINGETVQDGRTSQLIFDVPAILERLSAVTPLLPGDVVFTGTPAGVGMGRTPERWLAPGDELVSRIDGIGEMHHRMIG